MTHKHLPPTYPLARPRPVTTADLARALERVGGDFPAVGAVLYGGWVSAA